MLSTKRDKFHKAHSGISRKHPGYTLRYPNQNYDVWYSTNGTDQPRKWYNKMSRIRPFSLVSEADQGGKWGPPLKVLWDGRWVRVLTGPDSSVLSQRQMLDLILISVPLENKI